MKTFVTGMGALTSLGTSVEQSFQGLLENKSGVRYFADWEKQKGLGSYLGAPVPDYNISDIPRTTRRTMSRMSEMALLATFEALQQANLPVKDLNSPRILLIMGSTTGSPTTMHSFSQKLMERGGPEGQVSTSFFKIMNHSVAANVASGLNFHGPLLSPSSACATSSQAMILGWELIKSGAYDIVIAGGADELHFISASIFDIVLAASRKYNETPELTPRPFDQLRDGLVVSEGAAIIVMESEESADARGATKLAEFCGGASICDASHMSQSNATTMVEVMHSALERAGRKVGDIGYVNAHATGTIHGDVEEARAIENVLGKSAPVSSLKAHFGHTLSACGTLEAIASIRMMQEGILIPTRNLKTIDPGCAGIDHLVQTRRAQIDVILTNNFAFGGMNTSMILSRPHKQD